MREKQRVGREKQTVDIINTNKSNLKFKGSLKQ